MCLCQISFVYDKLHIYSPVCVHIFASTGGAIAPILNLHVSEPQGPGTPPTIQIWFKSEKVCASYCSLKETANGENEPQIRGVAAATAFK